MFYAEEFVCLKKKIQDLEICYQQHLADLEGANKTFL